MRNIFYLGEMFPESLIEKAQRLLPGVCIKPLAYTSQETGPVGFQCSYLVGNQYHIYEHVGLWRNPDSGELSVTVNYPRQSHLLNHMMGDVGDLEQGVSCPCGYRGDVLHLHGRAPGARNILGASISIYEFVRVLSTASAGQLTDVDLQLVELNHEDKGLGLVLMICPRRQIATENIPELLKSSPLIQELINKSLYFHVLIADKNTFLKSEITQKIKPFITTRTLPDKENSVRLIVK